MVEVGDIVLYRLSHADALRVVHQRMRCTYDLFGGKDVNAGDIAPMVVTTVEPEADGRILRLNGHVLLDGNDSLWVAHATFGAGDGSWMPRKQ